MKKLSMIFMAALLVLAFSCKKEKTEEKPVGQGFSATMENQTGDDKTHLVGKYVWWEQGDAILVSNGTLTERFTLTSSTEDYGYFDADGQVDQSFFNNNYTAYYPAPASKDAASWSGNNVTLSGSQTYTVVEVEDSNGGTTNVSSFASGANPMVAHSTSTTLSFKNLCGLLALQLTGSCSVSQIELTAIDGESLYGTFQLEGTSLSYVSGGGSTITLNCGGVQLNSEHPTTFYFVLPPVTLSQGFSVKLTDTENKVWEKSASAQTQISRNSLKKMAQVNVVPAAPVSINVTLAKGDVFGTNNYFTYTVNGNASLSTSNATEYGIVYNTTGADPTIADSKVVKGSGSFTGEVPFTVDLTTEISKTAETTYHVLAYAIVDGTPIYSDEVLTVTVPKPWIGGASPYPFSVGSGKKVYISKGNLQYSKAGASLNVDYDKNIGGTWSFAEQQYEFLGSVNRFAPISNLEQVPALLDLFAWATSGYKHYNGDCDYQPWTKNGSHWPYGGDHNLYDNSGKADWGYNEISNGGTGNNKWRTLKFNEWGSLLGTLQPSYLVTLKEGRKFCSVCNRSGLVILPDDWKGSTTISNSYNDAAWSKMEKAGAVFLPTAGTVTGSDDTGTWNSAGFGYWSSEYIGNYVYVFTLYNNSTAYPMMSPYGALHEKYAVRLVKNAN